MRSHRHHPSSYDAGQVERAGAHAAFVATNGLYLVFSNGVGLDDGEVRTGHAMILDPYFEQLNADMAPH